MVLKDGRLVMPQLAMIDTGSTACLIMEEFSTSIGLHYSKCSPVVRGVGGKQEEVLGVTEPLELCTAKGTKVQVSFRCSFIVMAGPVKMFDVLLGLPAMLPAAAFYDPWLHSLCYRPFLRRHDSPDDKYIAYVPCRPLGKVDAGVDIGHYSMHVDGDEWWNGHGVDGDAVLVGGDGDDGVVHDFGVA